MFGADKGQPTPLDGSALRIGIVQARFNEGVTDLKDLQPGMVLEGTVSNVAQSLADREEFDALIALGCIIRGETYHFELVANESGAGVTRVSLDHGIPVANAILTTENPTQAMVRQIEKGRDAARVAVEMALLKGRLG